MLDKKIFIGFILAGIGLIMFFNNKPMAKGAAKFYRKLYTEKNLLVMFKIAGGLLVLGGIFIALFE